MSTTPRRILLLVTDLEIGGTPTVVRELATRLNHPPDVIVEVACLSRPGPVADQLQAAGIEVTAFGATSAWSLLSVVKRLTQLIRDRRYDTVFSFLVHANAVAALASRRVQGVRWLQSIQTIQPWPKWHWRVQRWAQSAADKIVVPSTAVAQVARDRCNVEDARIVIIPNAIDPDTFPRVNVFADPTRVRIGFLGRLDPVKQGRFWVQSVWFADRDDIKIEGHIFGAGPDRSVIERDIADLNLAHRIFTHGPVNDPREVLAQMDVLYMTSMGEGFGLVVIEAMAAGVPVIAIRAGGITDILRDEENGMLITDEMFCYRQLGRRLDQLIGDPELRQRLIASALATVREKFTWQIVLPQYQQLLNLKTAASPANPPSPESPQSAPV